MAALAPAILILYSLSSPFLVFPPSAAATSNPAYRKV